MATTKTLFKDKNLYDNPTYNTEHWRPWVLVVAAIAAVVVGLGGVIVIALFWIGNVTQHNDQVTCNAWGKASNRAVRFVKYPWWNDDCLTPVPDDPTHWISNGSITVNQVSGVGK